MPITPVTAAVSAVPPRPELAGFEIGHASNTGLESPAINGVDVVTDARIFGAAEGYETLRAAITAVQTETAVTPSQAAAILKAGERFYGTGISYQATTATGMAHVITQPFPAGHDLPVIDFDATGSGKPGANVQALIDGSTVDF